MATKKMNEMGLEELAAYLKNLQLDQIDKQLRVIESKLSPMNALIEHRNRLQAARRALLNDRAVASGGGRGISQSEVINAMRDKDPQTVYEIAQALGATESVVRGHLNRGKGERFTKLTDNKWELREPENDDEKDDDE